MNSTYTFAPAQKFKAILVAVCFVGLFAFLSCVPTRLSNAPSQFTSEIKTEQFSCHSGDIFAIKVPVPTLEGDPNRFTTQSQILFTISYFSNAIIAIETLDTEVDSSGPRATAAGLGVVLVPCVSVFPLARDIFAEASKVQTYNETISIFKKRLLGSSLYFEARNFHRKERLIPESSKNLFLMFASKESQKTGDHFYDWYSILGSKNWDFKIKNPSRAKARARAIFTSKDGQVSPSMSIALTLNAKAVIIPKKIEELDWQSLDNAEVLETELIVKREDDSGQWDFFEYGKKGIPEGCSTFFSGKAIVVGPSPHTCLSCHLKYDTKTFQRIPESFKGQMITDWSSIDPEKLQVIDSCHNHREL